MTSPGDTIAPAGASEGCRNPIIGGGGALVYPSIHSPNFSAGPPVVGWSIDKNGNAFFSGTIGGTDYIINAAGAFFYNGTPAAGNLAASITSVAGSDSFGNPYPSGFTTYGTHVIANLLASMLQWMNQATPFVAQPTISGSGQGGAGQQAAVNVTSGQPTLAATAASMTVGSTDGGSPQTVVGTGPTPILAATTALLEVQGTGHYSGILTPGAGTNGSGSAPSPGQSLAINAAAAQLSDLTRDYMLYLTFSGAGNVTVQAGPTSAVARTIYPTAAAVAGAPYPLRMPAGWFIKCTGTGTVAIASQTVVGC